MGTEYETHIDDQPTEFGGQALSQELQNIQNSNPEQVAMGNGEVLTSIANQLEAAQPRTMEELSALPKLTSVELQSALVGEITKVELEWVAVDAIVGRSTTDEDGWAHEIPDRAGRIAEVAAELKQASDESLQDVFHLDDTTQQLRVRAIDGPAGPIYLAEDGTHRIAGAKLIGLEQVPAKVERTSYPLTLESSDTSEISHWQQLLNAGMMIGQLETSSLPGGDLVTRLHVESEVTPWVRTKGQWELAKISQTYEQVYPNSLDNLSVPREALTDEVAFNYYLAGRWEDWQAREQVR